jgi:hypothetical protein
MKARVERLRRSGLAALLLAIGLAVPQLARAHCDTLDGPVVADARVALEKNDVTPVLKWVRGSDEAEIREAFQRAVTVRALGPEARQLADLYFFESFVRIHRAGEGAPYTGLKAAGTDLGPAISGTDLALESGSVDAVIHLVTADVSAGIRERFARAVAAKRRADESVEAGRDFVAAYVGLIHYVERLHDAAVTTAAHGHAAQEDGHATLEDGHAAHKDEHGPQRHEELGPTRAPHPR